MIPAAAMAKPPGSRISALHEDRGRTRSIATFLKPPRLCPSGTALMTSGEPFAASTSSLYSKEWTPLLPPKRRRRPLAPPDHQSVLLAHTTKLSPEPKPSKIPPHGKHHPNKGAGEITVPLSTSSTTKPPVKEAYPQRRLSPTPAVVRIDFEDQRKLLVGYDSENAYLGARRPYVPANTPVGLAAMGKRISWRQRMGLVGVYYAKLFGVATVYCVLLILTRAVADSSFPYCEHPIKCFELSREMKASMNPGADPCKDMYEYVCGRWTQQYPRRRHQFALLNERLRFALFRAVEDLRDSSTASSKAGQALASCMGVWQSEDVENIGAISDLLNRRGLIWPATQNVPVKDVFRQLVAFTLKDVIGVFFKLKLFTYLRTEDRHVFEIRHPELVMSPMLDPEELKTCIQTYNSSVDVNGLAMQIINLELDYSTSVTLNAAYDFSPKYYKFGDLDALYNSSFIASKWWVHAINENLPKDAAVDSESVFLLYDDFALSSAVDILSAYADKTMNLQNFIGWKIIRHLSYGASSRLSKCDFPGGEDDWAFTFTLSLERCLSYVNDVLPYGLLNLQLSGVLTDLAIPYARNLTKDLRSAIEMSYNFSWLDERSAHGAVRRLRSIHAIVGAPTKLLAGPELDAYYRHVPSVYKSNFLQWLLDSCRAVAERRIRLVYAPDHPDHHSPSRDDWELTDISPNAFYLPTYHIIYVPGSIIMPPFLDASAPDAFNYGSLGKVIGHELTHAFDPKYIDVNYAREPDVFYTPQFKEKFLEKIDCLILQANAITEKPLVGEQTITESLADNAGTQVAYLAYSTLVGDSQQSGVAGLTLEQSFFAATCFPFCGADAETYVKGSTYLPLSLRCNQPLMNMVQFADAFSCPVGAPMRPPKRCDVHSQRTMGRR
ncbi:hypothetical protein V5799_027284 [Amblyomma americanum]|uniref:M13 family peptidase n=1 Tax=Amblyomma americanum TaxID=6943 RepID=A0AAQ4DG59_AMBAM